jgi:DNA-binding transcriptional MerR regulator
MNEVVEKDKMGERRFAIREVSDLTGVKPVTLRAWQRRYNLIKPERTDKGHRMYRQQDIDQIIEIQSWLSKGISISKVAKLIKQGANPNESDLQGTSQLDDVDTLLEALSILHRGKAESVINSVLKEYPLDVVEAQFIEPVFQALLHVKRGLASMQRGLFQSLMLSKLNSIIESENKVANSSKLLLVSFDPLGSLAVRLWGLRLLDSGANITLIEAVEDCSGLTSIDLGRYDTVAVHSEKMLTQMQTLSIEQLEVEQSVQVVWSPLLEKLR